MNIPTRTEKAVLSRLKNNLYKSALELICSEFVSKEESSPYNWVGEFLNYDAPSTIVKDLLTEHPSLSVQLDNDDNCALFHAARKHRADAVEMLVALGVDINKKLNGYGNCLNVAARYEGGGFIRKLVGMGADPFFLSDRGETSLDIARRWGNYTNVTVLEELNENPKLISKLKTSHENVLTELTL